MEPDKLMTGISKEMATALRNMSKAKSVEERLMHSEIVKNLSESLGVFINMMGELAMFEDEEAIPF